MENPTTVRCGAPSSCSAPPRWRFAVAFPWESAIDALERQPQYRCGEHMDLSTLTWLPELSRGLMVVVDPFGLSPSPDVDEDRSDTQRMTSHLIDADKLRPAGRHRKRHGDATQVMAAVVPVPGQLLVPGVDR